MYRGEGGGRTVLDLLWTAFVDGDADRLRQTLHPDVAFFSPAFAEPTVGAATVTRVLITARGVYSDLIRTHRYDDGAGGGALYFTARVDDREIQGAYRADVAGPAVVRLDALFRPVAAADALVTAMMARLAAGGPA